RRMICRTIIGDVALSLPHARTGKGFVAGGFVGADRACTVGFPAAAAISGPAIKLPAASNRLRLLIPNEPTMWVTTLRSRDCAGLVRVCPLSMVQHGSVSGLGIA